MKGIANPLSRQKVYRIVMYSKDRISGDSRDGVYAVDLPDFIQDINKYHVAVEDFLIHCELSNTNITRTLLVEASMTQPDTYSTSSRSASRLLLTMSRNTTAQASTSYYKPITSKTYGIPLSDVSFLRSKQMRITFKQVDDTAHTDLTLGVTNWVMTLIIYPFLE